MDTLTGLATCQALLIFDVIVPQIRRFHICLFMNSEVDQHCGKPLQGYDSSYEIAATRDNVLANRVMKEEVQQLEETTCIHTVNSQKKTFGMVDALRAQGITLSMLKVVLKLRHSLKHLKFGA